METYRVVLLNPVDLNDSPEVACECETRAEAEAWCEEWEREPLGLVAVVWPRWAQIP